MIPVMFIYELIDIAQIVARVSDIGGKWWVVGVIYVSKADSHLSIDTDGNKLSHYQGL